VITITHRHRGTTSDRHIAAIAESDYAWNIKVSKHRSERPPGLSNTCSSAPGSGQLLRGVRGQARTMLNDARSATVQAGGFHSGQANRTTTFAACPIRAQYSVQSRSLTAIRGQSLPLHVRKPPSQSLKVFVFQAGHASSILVTRASASLRANSLFNLPKLFEHLDDKTD
jgi:hypothetical protein